MIELHRSPPRGEIGRAAPSGDIWCITLILRLSRLMVHMNSYFAAHNTAFSSVCAVPGLVADVLCSEGLNLKSQRSSRGEEGYCTLRNLLSAPASASAESRLRLPAAVAALDYGERFNPLATRGFAPEGLMQYFRLRPAQEIRQAA